MAKKKVTSSQVAEKAGVSQATVSMILNRRNNVSFSEETIENWDMNCRIENIRTTAKKKN